MQQLRAAPHDPVVFLGQPGQVARDVDEEHQGNPERGAELHETTGLVAGDRVEAAGQVPGVVGDHADGAATEPAQSCHGVAPPVGVQLHDAARIQQCADHRPGVVGAALLTGHQRTGIGTSPGVGIYNALVAEQRHEAAGTGERRVVRCRQQVGHAAARVRSRTAEAIGVDDLAGDLAQNVRASDEQAPGGTHDDDVGECRAVCRAARGRAEHHR